MKIVFADTFIPSMKRALAHDRWYWKTIDLLRYDIPRFCTNVWQFRKELWNNYSFDSYGALGLLKRNLERTVKVIEFHGNEVDDSRLKKVAKIKRAIELLQHHIDDDFIDMAEDELFGIKLVMRWNFGEQTEDGTQPLIDDETPGEKENNDKILKLANKIEKDTWKELFQILQGQDHDEFIELLKNKTDEEKRSDDLWYTWFDGSGLKAWWD